MSGPVRACVLSVVEIWKIEDEIRFGKATPARESIGPSVYPTAALASSDERDLARFQFARVGVTCLAVGTSGVSAPGVSAASARSSKMALRQSSSALRCACVPCSRSSVVFMAIDLMAYMYR